MSNLKEVAKSARASYRVLRKWRAEKSFQQLTNTLADEYLDVFFDAFIKLAKQFFSWGVNGNEGKKDNIVRDHESRIARWLLWMLDYADDEWGFVLQERAHARIEKYLKQKEHDDIAAFLRILDMICVVRSKGRIKIDSNYFLKSQKSVVDAVLKMHHDLSVASDRSQSDTTKAYADALASFAILVFNKFCEISTRYLGKKRSV